MVLVLLDVLDVLVEKVRRVHRSALGFGVKLCTEDGARGVNDALVGLVVQVGEVLPPLTRQRGRVDGVSVVLGGDVTLAGGEVERWDVVGTVAVLELDGLGAGSEGNQLVAHTDTHDRDLGGLKQLAEVVDGGRAVSGVTWTVRDEDTVEVVGDLVDGVVEGEASDAGTAGDEAAKDVLLDTAVDQSNVHVTERRADVEGSLGRNTADQVDGLGVDVGLVLVGIILLTHSDAGQRRTLLTEVCHNLTSVHTRDGGNTFASAPLGQRLDGSPVAVPQSIVLDNDTRGLDVRRLKESEQAVLIAGGGWHAVVANEGLGEDKNLSTVGGIRHGFGVADQRGGEDGLARDVGFGAKRLARKDGAILHG